MQQIHIEMPQDGYIRNNKSSIQKWRLVDKKIPTLILDLCSHVYSLSSFLIKEKPKKIFSNFSKFSKMGVVDDAIMQLQFEKGIKGYFWSSKVAAGNRNSLKIKILCSKGSAEWNHLNPEELKISSKNNLWTTVDRGSKTTTAKKKRYNRFKPGHPSGFMEAFANLYFDMSEALISYKKFNKYKNPYVFNQDFELENMEVLTKATLSNFTGRWQKIKFFKNK